MQLFDVFRTLLRGILLAKNYQSEDRSHVEDCTQ